MAKLLICDLDGVTVDARARFEKATRYGKIDWDTAFNPALVELDIPMPGTQDILNQLEREGYRITFLTSRPEHMGIATRDWLYTHGFIPDGDTRDLILKPAEEQYTRTVQWKADEARRLADFHEFDEIYFVDDEIANCRRVEALKLGITCCTSLAQLLPQRAILINAFAPGMLASDATFSFQQLTAVEFAQKLEGQQPISYIGHASTAEYLSHVLGQQIAVNRERLTFEPGMILYAIDINTRLPEGKILNLAELQELGIQIRYWLIQEK